MQCPEHLNMETIEFREPRKQLDEVDQLGMECGYGTVRYFWFDGKKFSFVGD